MQHPFDILRSEYTQLLAAVQVRPECVHTVNTTAAELLDFVADGKYDVVSAATGVPIIWMAASFEREAGSDFRLSPAQGDRWDRPSIHVPKNRGPFNNWAEAARDAYHLDGLDQIGAENWTWERACYEGELFNGFGYRDYQHMHSPYLWGSTTIQQKGKYTTDGRFDPTVLDSQLGIVPIMMRMVQLKPALALANALPISTPTMPTLPSSAPVGVGGGDVIHDTVWIQQQLNKAGTTPLLVVDGNYGHITRQAVAAFQKTHHLTADGLVGPETIAALEQS
jgi:lysozyme family protein